MARENEGLKSLGKKTEYRRDYAPEVLETFSNYDLPGTKYERMAEERLLRFE